MTLSGVGGVGKTSLALAVAAELQPEFVDGAWLVELGAVVSREAALAVTSAVLGVKTDDADAAVDGLVSGLAPREPTTLDALMAEGAALDEEQAFALAQHPPS